MANSKTMAEKLEAAAPYNLLYNHIPGLPEGPENSVSFTDFLCPSLGTLKCSLQIVSKVDIELLMAQYDKMNVGTKPVMILYGELVSGDDGKTPVEDPREFEKMTNVTLRKFPRLEQPERYNRHEKLSIYVYEDNSLRVVISSGNLYESQWNRFHHGFWVSPKCRQLPSDASGESPTNFKRDLLGFLSHYQLSDLEPYIDYVKMADFSDVMVFLIATYPGFYQVDHRDTPLNQMERLIEQHCTLTTLEDELWSLVAQASNMGKFGFSPNDWLMSFFAQKLLPNGGNNLKIVFPTWKQVMNGEFPSEQVGTGLRYSRNVHNKQKWLNNYLYAWQADGIGRTGIIPHTKTYCRLSPNCTKMAWFLFTTGNINRGAWGQLWKSKDPEKNGKVFVRNCEIGVLFFPKFFNEKYFRVLHPQEFKHGGKFFPLIYDVPLKKYSPRDHPWSVWEERLNQ